MWTDNSFQPALLIDEIEGGLLIREQLEELVVLNGRAFSAYMTAIQVSALSTSLL